MSRKAISTATPTTRNLSMTRPCFLIFAIIYSYTAMFAAMAAGQAGLAEKPGRLPRAEVEADAEVRRSSEVPFGNRRKSSWRWAEFGALGTLHVSTGGSR